MHLDGTVDLIVDPVVFFYRSREAVKLGCRKILLDKISSFGYSMVDESIRRPTGT